MVLLRGGARLNTDQGEDHQVKHGWLGRACRGEEEMPDELMRARRRMHTVSKPLRSGLGGGCKPVKHGCITWGKL